MTNAAGSVRCWRMPWTDVELATSRMRLWPWRESNRATWLAMHADADVRRFLGGPLPDGPMERLRQAPIGVAWGVFCATELTSGVPMGSFYLGRFRGELELSYELLPQFWQQGYAQEGCAALLAWAWVTQSDHSVIAVTQTANVPSRRLLARLDFIEERTFLEWGSEQVQARLQRPPIA